MHWKKYIPDFDISHRYTLYFIIWVKKEKKENPIYWYSIYEDFNKQKKRNLLFIDDWIIYLYFFYNHTHTQTYVECIDLKIQIITPYQYDFSMLHCIKSNGWMNVQSNCLKITNFYSVK